MGLASIASHKLGGILSDGTIFKASIKIGQSRAKFRAKHQVPEALQILQEKDVRQPGTKEEIICEECIPSETFDRTK